MESNKICIVGLGYVGLPLGVAFAEKMHVVGFDIDESRILELKNGHDASLEVEGGMLEAVKESLIYTSDIQSAKDCNVYIITVPTPIDKLNKPDLTPLLKASKTVGSVLNSGDIVIYESTVYPGVTEEICAPELERSSGLEFNRDFFCGYSPERINPGDKEHTVTKILKVTSGSTPEIARRVNDLYKQIILAGTYSASSIKVAEASKVIENTQRDVNIALINELALIFDQMNIDTNEVINAAATKWNFVKLTPGLVGGHCIGVDPYYLTFKAEELGYKPNLILSSRQINNGMGKYISDKAIKLMIKSEVVIKNSSVLILGATFKENCPDMRNSKVVDIIENLEDFGASVDVYDPWIDLNYASDWFKCRAVGNPLESKKKYDAIVVAVGHKEFCEFTPLEYEKLSKKDSLILDVKNIVENPTWKL